MSTFNLRPVTDLSPSPSSSVSTTTAGDRSPPAKPPRPHSSPSSMQPRRPLSPTSLRDVNLTQNTDTAPRKYPAPPTGHELMALFPPAPPASFPEMRPGPTSGYFQRQERAFFAQAGKEIVRVRVEIDVPHEGEDGYAKAKSRDSVPPNGVPRSWPQLPSHPQHHSSPSQTSAAPPLPHPHAGSSRQTRAVPIQMQQTSLFPMTPHGQAAQPPPNLHAPTSHHTSLGLQTPPHDSHSGAPGAKVEFQTAEEYREESDEAWRRPMPYADRRRAGKHTRRVIVRN